MNKLLKDKLSTLPKKPGCYMMKDVNDKIIYVGKAINLKNRVNSYFKGVHDYKTTKLVSNINDFSYIVTNSEKEALILEYNLIKEYDPKYNVIFKDDKSYPYILLSDDDVPYCKSIRISKKTKYKGKIFGPYPDIGAANNTVDLINRLFLTRKCKTLSNNLCLYYHINQCKGYCKYDIPKEEMLRIKNDIEVFLKGDNKAIINQLKSKIDESIEILDFEKAAEYRDLINDINYVTNNKQNVQVGRKEDFDVFVYYVEDGYISIVGLFIRNGKLINKDLHISNLYGEPEEEFISYVYQFYSSHLNPKQLIIHDDIDTSLLKDSLDLNINYYSRGFKKQMFNHALENAKINLNQNKTIIKKDEMYYSLIADDFKKYLNIDALRIELFDNSHIGGELTCAAMVVYENYKPNKKEYRLYRLDDSFDDLKSMHEVLYRRYYRVLVDGLKRPDLIIVDGAINQIKVAKDILSSLNLNIKLVGLGKDKTHNTAYLMDDNFNIINIDPKSKLFLYLASMQDEVHRFAIDYNRKLRKKKAYSSKLDDIEGLGKKRRLELLRKHKTISNISNLTIEELSTVLPKKVAENVYNKLNKGE